MLTTLKHVGLKVDLDQFLIQAYLSNYTPDMAAKLAGVKISYVRSFFNGCHAAITNRGIQAPENMQKEINILLAGEL